MRLVNTDVKYHNQVNFTGNWGCASNWALRSKISHQQWRGEDIISKLTLHHYF